MLQDIVLELISLQNSFQIGEPIVIKLFLFNYLDDPLVFNSRFGVNLEGAVGEVFFKIVGPDGEALPFSARVNMGSPMMEDFSFVQPNACVGSAIHLERYFNFEQAGVYTIEAFYNNSFEQDLHGETAWTGSLKSNALQLEIK